MSAPRAMLLIRFSSIGDIVQTTAVCSALRQTYPDTRLDFMTLTTLAPLLEGHADIDRLICVDRSAGVADLLGLGRRLRAGGYDLVVDLHNTLRARIIRSRMPGLPALVYTKPRWKRFLLYTFHINTFDPGYALPEALLEVVRPCLGPGVIPSATSLSVAAVESRKARERLQDLGLGPDFAGLVPGAAWPQKQWLVEYYAELIRRLQLEFALEGVLLGAGKDRICAAVAREAGGVRNLQGGTTLREALAILSLARLVVGSDTGLVHAAAALGRPTLMILGPTSRETGAGTRQPRAATSEQSLWCRPCSQNGSRLCYRERRFCLELLTPERVLEDIRGLGLA